MKIRDTWATPPDLRAAITKAFGAPALDTCAEEHNAFIRAGGRYYDIHCGDNGLRLDWTNVAYSWCNPPGSQVAQWTAKALEEAKRGRDSVLLVHCGIESSWYTAVRQHCETIFLTPRPQFVPPAGVKMSSNPRNYMLLVFTRRYANIPGERVKWWNWKGAAKNV